MRNENVEAMVRDKILKGRELGNTPEQNMGKYPLFGLRRGPVVTGDRRSN